MTDLILSRRAVMLGVVALAASGRAALAETRPMMRVMKDPGCGCCQFWVDILRDEGFDVETEHLSNGMLMRRKIALGVPQNAASCHTGVIDGYVIEGHVPAADIRRLLEKRPDAIGLTVPGMPYGSPGMGPENQREAYDVYLIGRDGGLDVFSSYAAGKNA